MKPTPLLWIVAPVSRPDAGGTLFNAVRVVGGKIVESDRTPSHSYMVAKQAADELNAAAPASYAPEVIADSSGKWCGNMLRFATREEAEASARNLAARWTLVRDWRAAPSDDPPGYRWDAERGCAMPLKDWAGGAP